MVIFINEFQKLIWNNVSVSDDVSVTFDLFSNYFNTLIEKFFFKNQNKIEKKHKQKYDFMITGLLIYRQRKLELHRSNFKPKWFSWQF